MKLTVITAVYNQVAALEETMQSVFRFERPDLEYIIVDGGSTDGSVDLINDHSAQLKYWLSEPDEGVYDAMNKGWTLASLDSRILYLGAGDKLLELPESQALEDDPNVILYGDVKLERGDVFHAKTGFWLRLYNSLHHQALLVPKGLHPEPPFDLAYPLYADFDFNQRLCRAGAMFRFDPQLLAYAAPDGMTRDMHLDELAKIVLKNYGPLWKTLSTLGFSLSRIVPFLRVLRPIDKSC